MNSVVVLSHHKKGGGKPLDSFWFSREECDRQGVQLRFLWTRKISSYWQLFSAQRVVFDGAASLVRFRGYNLYALSQLLGTQTAIYWHETEWGVEKAIQNQPRWYPVIQQVLKNPRVVHFHVCRYGLKMLQERYGVDSKNLFLLHNISEPTRLLRHQLPLPSEANLFVGCGLVGEKKGVDLFLDIATQVIAQGLEAKFVWIGSFGEEQFTQVAIAQEIARRGLEKNVFFTGAMADPTEIIAKASAFLLTSRDDPMPKVLMEALALGKSCIAFEVGGVPELLGRFGTVVAPEDTEAFAQALGQRLPENDTEQQHRREWYLQRYSPTAFGESFAQAVQWWNQRSQEWLN